MPTKLEFATNAGAAFPTLRMTIPTDGGIEVGHVDIGVSGNAEGIYNDTADLTLGATTSIVDFGANAIQVNSIEVVGVDGEVNKAAVEDSGNWDTAYTHSQDNTQAHSDYLLNNANDSTTGTLTLATSTATALTIGDGSATDFAVKFDASANDGNITFDESAGRFLFDKSITAVNALFISQGFYAEGDETTRLLFLLGQFYVEASGVEIFRAANVAKQDHFTINNGDTADIDFIYTTSAGTDLLKTDSGLQKVYMGDGGATNYAEFTATGNLTLAGSAVLDWSNQPCKPKIYSQATEPAIGNDTCAFWIDTDDGKYYLVLDIGGTQKKVELT